ncbi:TPM domain-containing protein [Prosthecobacter vanneervenii]|uniref:TPM domain-containing protein n=1 Tax=Prosthecobacter vanneervenii TaxID=48466 RepID=A0A7W8DJE5_9BACT|nr:hypothetical protein [Prosthecobacter vanneervenii]MBB5032073.1 hypothetical protein [Prosthecobacter vanneervenii]
MKCPRCLASVLPEQTTCSTCGFSAKILHNYLGNQWVRLERITDVAHCLRLEDTRRAEIVLDDFERSFPQAFFAVYLGALPSNMNVAELGFWLLNQGAFNTHSVSRRNDFGIILVIDPVAKTACFTLGYAVEHCFRQRTLSRMLQNLGSHLRKGAYGAAIEASCLSAGAALKKYARSMQWQPESAPVSDSMSGIGLQPLRSGHRASSRPLSTPP